MQNSDMVTGSLVEGIGDDLVNAFFVATIVTVPLIIYAFVWHQRRNAQHTIHTESQGIVEDIRDRLRNTEHPQQLRRTTRDDDLTCPICITQAQFAIETNCGHVFCGQCMTTYWQTGTWRGAVRCPVCRQQVTLLLRNFSDQEMQDTSPEKQSIEDCINRYNRRFSGEPIPWTEYIRDLPTILRHVLSEFFTVGGLIWMFRLRIIVCFLLAFLYLVSPLDVIPEAVFGFFGLLDDLFIFLLLGIYISIIYRQVLANRGAAVVD